MKSWHARRGAWLAMSLSVACSDAKPGAVVSFPVEDASFGAAEADVDVADSNIDARDASDESQTRCADPTRASTPIEYGTCELDRVQARLGTHRSVTIVTAAESGASQALADAGLTLDARPESYAVVSSGGNTQVIGRDEVGAMYGALELAERLELDGPSAFDLPQPLTGTPSVQIRGANPFLVLPSAGETKWWFLDESFWREYVDMLARARINFLDLHGMYDLESTIFPNALLYFATSASYPDIGVPPAERDRNVAMLGKIIGMANARGVRVGLMSYRADTSPRGTDTPNPLDEAGLLRYTREAVADLASRAKGLWRLGFRIGESGRAANWYTSSFVAGVNDANSGVGVYTRTWLALKPEVMAVVQAAPGETIVETKYNGEQFGAPYVIAGGEFANWASYSYEDFLDPPTPYSLIFQLRAGGTNRIFRFASYARSVRTVQSFSLSSRVHGFTFEPAHAFFPQRDFYHADPADRFSEWTFRRDELSYLLLGRLSYDPNTAERVFQSALAKRVGTSALWDPLQASSDIVQWIQTAHTCGPDSREFAAELELGGDVGYWASPRHSPAVPNACGAGNHGPFDSFAIASPFEAAADLTAGLATTRLAPADVANLVLDDVRRAREVSKIAIADGNVEARDVVRECVAVADLGEYFAHKLRAATALAVYATSGKPEWLASARDESSLSSNAWRALADHTAYIAPFEDRLRMWMLGVLPFHWKAEVERLAAEGVSIDRVQAAVVAAPPSFTGILPDPASWFATARSPGPGLSALEITPADAKAPSWTVAAVFSGPIPSGAVVNVLHKPFDSHGVWNSVPATLEAGKYVATVAGTGRGALFAVEVAGATGQGWRYPDVLRETPYRTIAP